MKTGRLSILTKELNLNGYDGIFFLDTTIMTDRATTVSFLSWFAVNKAFNLHFGVADQKRFSVLPFFFIQILFLSK